jgi:aromatase
MPRIENSIVINAEPLTVFEITNNIARWSEIFNEYSDAKVISTEHEGRYTELVFELTNKDGATWQSWRLLDHRKLVAIAERQDPLYPFRYMHLKWTYEQVDQGTRMTWIQDFELDEKFDTPLPTAVERMVAHTRENQQGIKEKIESGSVRPD